MLFGGLFTPSTGEMYVLGTETTSRDLRQIRKRLGLVFQDPDDQLFCPTLSEDIAFGPLNMGLSEEEVCARVKHVLKLMRLDGYEEKPPHHLSAGEKKKAAMATVLAMQPDILLLDEPTANLDPQSRLELLDIIRALCENHDMTLVVATHDVNILPGLVDRVLVMNGGRILKAGSIRDVFSDPDVINQAKMELPIIAQFFHLMAKSNVDWSLERTPLNIDEALHAIQRLVKDCRSGAEREH
jgi:cobalt/nickel transport system ATP-binding protein